MPAPVTASTTRIVGVDLARMLALVGMYAAHLTPPLDPAAPGGVDPLFQLVAGRSSALFAVLAGVGIVLATRSGGDPLGQRVALVTRTALVALIGLLLGSLGSGVAVILTFYGVLFLAALPVLHWRTRSLALLAGALALASPVLSMLLRRVIDAPSPLVPSLDDLARPGPLLTELLLTGYYPVLTWCTYLFAGMAVGRLDLRRATVDPRLAVLGAALAAASLAVASLVTSSPEARAALLADPRRPVADWPALQTQMLQGMYGTHPSGTAWWLGVWAPHSGTVVDLIHTTGCALLVLGLALWLLRLTPVLPWPVLAGAGAMTLTLYSAHVVVLASPLAVAGSLPLLIHTVAAVFTGALFARARVRGPLEQLVGTLSRDAAARAVTAYRATPPR